MATIYSLSLHIANQAIGLVGPHREWVRRIVPTAEFRSGQGNKIGAQIEYHVRQELDVEPEPQPDTGWRTSFDENLREERSQFLTAYEIIWEIETTLHRFVALHLQSAYGSDSGGNPWWMTVFPAKIRQECIEQHDSDGRRRVSVDCYLNLHGVGEVVKYNREAFKKVFESLQASHGDAQSRFHQGLERVNRLRNDVMHPLKRLTPDSESIANLRQFLEFVSVLTAASDAHPA